MSYHDSALLQKLEKRWMFAGVTLVTHGLQDGFDPEPWVAEMADSIADLAGPQTPVYKLKITMEKYGNPYVDSFARLSDAVPSSVDDKSGEVAVILDWAGASGVLPGWYNRTDTIASMVAPYLINSFPSIGINQPLAELPIHLVGHSRGGSVITELARDLGEAGIWVDHVTTLDPHPVSFFRDDPEIQLAENIFFADNYYQTSDLITGEFVDKSLNYDLTSLPAYSSHSGIHEFYQDSISDPGTGIGFDFSLLRGGERDPDGISKYFTSAGGTAERWAVSRQGSQWPNIGNLTVRDSDGIITRGDPLPVRFLFQDADSGVKIDFFLDSDGNPYNNNVYSIGIQSWQSTGASVAYWDTAANATAQAPPGKYELLARISDDGGHERFAYADRLVTLKNPAPSIALLMAPKTVRKPSSFALKAMGITSSASSVQQVAFFLDSNRNGRYDANDQLFGRDMNAAGGWQIKVSSRRLRNGNNRFFAFAFDGTAWSGACTTVVRVRA